MHPDRGGCAEDFKKLQHAHEILSDEAKRRDYDFNLKYGRPYVDPPVDPREAQAEHPYARYRQPPPQQPLTSLQAGMWFVVALGLGLSLNAISLDDRSHRYTDDSAKKPLLKIRSNDEVIEKTRAYWNPVSNVWERLSESQGAPTIRDFVNFYNIPYEQRYGLPRYLREEQRPIDETVEATVVQDLKTLRAVRVSDLVNVQAAPADAIKF